MTIYIMLTPIVYKNIVLSTITNISTARKSQSSVITASIITTAAEHDDTFTDAATTTTNNEYLKQVKKIKIKQH